MPSETRLSSVHTRLLNTHHSSHISVSAMSAPRNKPLPAVPDTKLDLQAFYEQKERVYHTLESRTGNREKIVLQLFPSSHPLRVLDIGCGSGRFLRILKGLGHDVIGLEISAAAVEAAKQSGVKAVVGNAESRVGLADVGADFDVITTLDVLEHTFDPPQVLRHLTALLKPGGCFIVSVPNVACFTARWQILCGRFPSEPSGIFDSGHIRWFTRSNLEAYVAKAGNLSLAACAANGVPTFNLRGYWRLKRLHDFVFTHLARAWPSVFGYQLIFKLTRVG
jgi:2-polyprenyl-3-methyl-5-hydroxy-6-metoxy-1,4-benzoquinol methylase